MISWSEVWGVYCTAWPGTDRRLYQLWSWWWPEIKGGEGVLRYSSNLYPSCCLQQNKIKWSLPRGEVRGWIYYERNYKASLTNESELTMTSNILVFNEIHFGRIWEINKYLWGTETYQTLYKHHINGRWEGWQLTTIGLSLLWNSMAVNIYFDAILLAKGKVRWEMRNTEEYWLPGWCRWMWWGSCCDNTSYILLTRETLTSMSGHTISVY